MDITITSTHMTPRVKRDVDCREISTRTGQSNIGGAALGDLNTKPIM